MTGRRGRVRTRIGYARLALRRRLVSVAPPASSPATVVVSPGGVATTTLMRHLGSFTDVNAEDDADGLKHMPWPPGWLDDNVKVIFVAGDAHRVMRSIDRRGWIAVQGAKLGSPLSVLLPPPLSHLAFRFAVRRQLSRWRRWGQAPGKQFLILTYEELWTRIGDIAQFLGVTDPAFCGSFPPRRSRRSVEEEAPKP